MKLVKFVSLFLAMTVLFSFTSMAFAEESYTISTHYTDANVGDIPADAVNQVMFAYTPDGVDVDFSTTLTLDRENMTYVLYKEIVPAPIVNEEGKEDRTYLGQYEFKGTFRNDETNASAVILEVPSEGRYNCYYPTVLNYQSIEKQTQDWVSAEEFPMVMTRFNKWYPAKNPDTVEQPVTLRDGVMEFAEVEFPAEKTEEEAAEETAETPASELPENGLIAAAADDKTLTLMADGTFEFDYPAYGITESGTWTWENFVLTVTPEGASEGIQAAFNENYNLALTYQCQKFSMITQDFVLENWGDALGTSGTYTVE